MELINATRMTAGYTMGLEPSGRPCRPINDDVRRSSVDLGTAEDCRDRCSRRHGRAGD